MLIDSVSITIKAGDGGDGAVSFRREKYVPKGGPDGGDGANGGDAYIVAQSSTHGLHNYRGKKRYDAQAGERGGKNRSSGKRGEDLLLHVPPGTQVIRLYADGSQHVIADLVEDGDRFLVAKGGRGGKGNWHFRSATNQTPREFEPGTEGELKEITLELRMLAEVGLIGMPNAGKSTLLSVISHAQPKIADYPFTTLEPNLGTVNIDDEQFVVADIPGLIEGAARGKGLGHAFLKHVLRTEVLVHLITATDEDPEKTYEVIRKELAEFDKALLDKQEIVVLSKTDLFDDWAEYHADFIKKHHAVAISSAEREGIKELLRLIAKKLAIHRASEPA
jgi:GTP-binding protein